MAQPNAAMASPLRPAVFRVGGDAHAEPHAGRRRSHVGQAQQDQQAVQQAAADQGGRHGSRRLAGQLARLLLRHRPAGRCAAYHRTDRSPDEQGEDQVAEHRRSPRWPRAIQQAMMTRFRPKRTRSHPVRSPPLSAPASPLAAVLDGIILVSSSSSSRRRDFGRSSSSSSSTRRERGAPSVATSPRTRRCGSRRLPLRRRPRPRRRTSGRSRGTSPSCRRGRPALSVSGRSPDR